MLRIGLTQRVEYLADRDERRDCLDQAWSRLLLDQEILPVPLPNALGDVESYVLDLELDGFILTGGNDLSHLPGATAAAPERDAVERRILELARARETPVLGVCRGLQMMVAESGGELVPIRGHVARPHGLELRSGHGMPLTDRELVNSFHNFGVYEDQLAGGWQAVALAPDGSVEAMAHQRYRQWAVMWHPERAPRDPRDLRLIRELFGNVQHQGLK